MKFSYYLLLSNIYIILFRPPSLIDMYWDFFVQYCDFRCQLLLEKYFGELFYWNITLNKSLVGPILFLPSISKLAEVKLNGTGFQ